MVIDMEALKVYEQCITQACLQQPGQWCHLVAAPSTHSSLNIKRTHIFINHEPCLFLSPFFARAALPYKDENPVKIWWL